MGNIVQFQNSSIGKSEVRGRARIAIEDISKRKLVECANNRSHKSHPSIDAEISISYSSSLECFLIEHRVVSSVSILVKRCCVGPISDVSGCIDTVDKLDD
jgi:hypothetical protein